MSIDVKLLKDFAEENSSMYCEIQMNDYMQTQLKVTFEREALEDDDTYVYASISRADWTSYTGWRVIVSGSSMEDISAELHKIALFDGEITALEVDEP